ncbi:MAG: hypothetical protein N2110_04095 [Flavobacteriales bacterium]|nr:hypothetical protein [Flavobacteriales bacterium]
MTKSRGLGLPVLLIGLFGGNVKTQASLLIRSVSNQILLSPYSAAFRRLFSGLDSLIRFGKNKVNVVLLGDSHVQADVYSHCIPQRLCALFTGLEGAGGFVFPQ